MNRMIISKIIYIFLIFINKNKMIPNNPNIPNKYMSKKKKF